MLHVEVIVWSNFMKAGAESQLRLFERVSSGYRFSGLTVKWLAKAFRKNEFFHDIANGGKAW